MWLITIALARIVAESGLPIPQLDQDAVLLVQRHNLVVPEGCGGGADAGVPPDAGAPPDAGVPSDGGVPPDAGCGMLGDAVTLIMKPTFKINAGGSRFAILLVTPARPLVEAVADPFAELAEITKPRILVQEHEVEDPLLGTRCPTPVGCGGTSSSDYDPGPSWDPPAVVDGNLGDGAVVVETIGPYEVLRTEPADRAELEGWLSTLGYAYSQADVDAVAPYIARGYSVVAVRVAVAHALDGALTPLALTWAGSDLRIPAGLGGTDFPLVVYIAADGRYELPGASVSFARYTSYQAMGFLTRNEVMFEQSATPDDDPRAVRISGDPQYQNETVEVHNMHIPVSDCGDHEDPEPVGCCGNCNSHRPVRFDLGLIAVAVLLVLRRRRRA